MSNDTGSDSFAVVAWLPEFWLTGLFAGLFVWSVVRDRGPLGNPTGHAGRM